MPSVFGHELDSELPLPRARAAPGPRGVIRIRRGPDELLDEPATITALDHHTGPDGAPVLLAVGRSAASDAYLLGCSVTGGYRVVPEALDVLVAPAGAPAAWEHRLLAVAVPVMLAQAGDLALHAAVIGRRDRAVLFCGPPARGKSSLSLAYARLGLPVLSEDGAILTPGPEREWLVWPGAAGARIRPEAGSPKRVVDLPGREPGMMPAAAVILLEPRGGDGTLAGMQRAQALVELSPHLLHAGGRDPAAAAFARLAGLLGTVPAFRVSLPDDLAALPATAAAMVSELDRIVAGRPKGVR